MPTASDNALGGIKALQATPAPSVNPEYLGAAKVVRCCNDHVVAVLEDGVEVKVAMAFAFPFTPQPGDSLLVMGQGQQFFAVGVLGGAAPKSLTFPGDAEIRTLGGTLTLASDTAVEVIAPRIVLRAGILRTMARSIVERADFVQRWVRGLLAVRAGSSRRQIDGEDSTRCQRSVVLAKETVKLDGDQLHLGH